MDLETKQQLEKEVEFLKKTKVGKLHILAIFLIILLFILARLIPIEISEYYIYMFPIVVVFVLVVSFYTLSKQGARLDSEKRLFTLLDKILTEENKK